MRGNVDAYHPREQDGNEEGIFFVDSPAREGRLPMDALGTIANVAQILQAVPLVVAFWLFLARRGSAQLRRTIWTAIVVVTLTSIVSIASLIERLGWWPLGKPEASVQAPWPKPYKPTSIVGRKFKNEQVILDGHSYSGCDFENVTFVYNGTTPVQFSNNNVHGDMQLKTESYPVSGAILMMRGFKLLKENVPINVPPGNKVDGIN
jgi:hypothetical protein